MKIKTTLTTLSAIIALAVSAYSQNGGSTAAASDAATGFSTFSAPQNLGAIVNSDVNDLLPTPAPNGLSLYFNSSRPGGQGGGDIWVSQRATLSSAWGAPQNLGAPLNTSGTESPTHISPDGREMFIQTNRPGGLPGGMNGTDMWVSTRTDPNNDFGWTTTRPSRRGHQFHRRRPERSLFC